MCCYVMLSVITLAMVSREKTLPAKHIRIYLTLIVATTMPARPIAEKKSVGLIKRLERKMKCYIDSTGYRRATESTTG